MDRRWQVECQQLLDERYQALLRTEQPIPRSPPLHVMPPLGEQEAEYFIRGIERELFVVDHHGCVSSSLLVSIVRELPAGSASLFATDGPQPRLHRLWICRWAAASALVLERGWLPRQVEVLDSTEEPAAGQSHADISIRSFDGELV